MKAETQGGTTDDWQTAVTDDRASRVYSCLSSKCGQHTKEDGDDEKLDRNGVVIGD